jgi:septal ring factor EnvC (AmiA/AmiB activator)
MSDAPTLNLEHIAALFPENDPASVEKMRKFIVAHAAAHQKELEADLAELNKDQTQCEAALKAVRDENNRVDQTVAAVKDRIANQGSLTAQLD